MVALCLSGQSVSMTEMASRADLAVAGPAQYPPVHGGWDRWYRLKRFCMPWALVVPATP